ncbi:MAG: HlyD family efflux transporter periplasmic adaptor subunit [Clostridium fessum]
MEENQSSGMSLSAENLADLKKQLSSFCLSYNDQRFESVYDAKYSLQASVAEYMNFNALGDMDAQLQAQGINYKQISAPQPGIISYVTDSFEGVAPDEVTADSFDRSQYTRQVGRAGELIEAGTPVYKIITSENWSIVFQMDDKDKEQFADQDTLTIESLGSDMKFRGNYSMFTGSDGNLYGRLDLDRYT